MKRVYKHVFMHWADLLSAKHQCLWERSWSILLGAQYSTGYVLYRLNYLLSLDSTEKVSVMSMGAAITSGFIVYKMKVAASNTMQSASRCCQGKYVYIACYNVPQLTKSQVDETKRLTPGHAGELRNLKALMCLIDSSFMPASCWWA